MPPSAPLIPGLNYIVAHFAGDGANDAPSTSAAKTLSVNSWPQIVTITSANTGTYGTPLRITATASSGLAAFTFAVIGGPATVSGGGQLSFTGIGAVVVQVSQSGNGNYAPASAQQTITVGAATPTLDVGTSLNPSLYGQSITFSADMSSSGPTGTVTFYDGGSPIGTGTLSGFGIATYATGALTAGTHSITASWTTNSPNYNSVTSLTPFSQVVKQATPAISWPVPTAIVYGTALSAAQLDATAKVPGTFVYIPALGTVLTAGSQTLSVTFTPTDTADYTTATKTVTLTVKQATPVIAWPTPAAIVYGTALSATQLDATATWTVGGSNGPVAGTFTYTPPAGTVLGAGVQTLSVTFAPFDTTDYATPATKTVSLTVHKATPTVSAWPTASAITYGQTLASSTLTGGTASVAGSFAFTTPSITPGAGTALRSVTFTPSDTTDYNVPSAGSVSVTVNKATPAITWPTPAPITYGTPLGAAQLDASASVAGTFAYTPGSGTVLPVGSQTLSVTFTPTSPEYTTVTQTAQLQVNKATPSIIWSPQTTLYYGNALGAAEFNATAGWTVGGSNQLVNGTFNYSIPAGTFLPVGTNEPLSVTFTPADQTDYTNAAMAAVYLTVLPAVPAVLTAPLPAGGATLPPGPTTVQWTPGSGPAAYQIAVGTGSPGWSDVYWSGIVTSTSTSVTIPDNGVDLWIRFWQSIAGVWSYTDYAYTESGTLVPASMQSPTPGTTISGTVTFNWAGGAGPVFYQLLVGTQGVGMADLYSSGSTHATSASVTIPADGVTVYVRLMQLINGAWESTDYTYTQTGSLILAAITSPSPGSVLGGSTVTFQWPCGVGPSQYQLVVGTIGVGSGDLYISSPSAATQATVNNIPADGATVFVRLKQRVNGAWQSTDYTYTEVGTLVPAQITSPTPGSTLPGASVTFNWPGASGPSEYQLLVGTTYAGSDNVYYSGVVTTTSETVTVPTNGVTIYVRLSQRINGAWQTTDYTYTESGSPTPPALQTPTTGTLLSGPTTFTWSAGAGPSSYQLAVETTGVGSANLYYLAPTTATSSASMTIPANGVKVFVRLDYRVNGVWNSIDYTYTESGTTVPAAITSPPPGSTLTGSSVTFNWAGGAGPAAYQLAVGTTYAGSNNVYYSGVVTATSETVTVPTTGATLYVRLSQTINGVWQSTDYTYTEQ